MLFGAVHESAMAHSGHSTIQELKLSRYDAMP